MIRPENIYQGSIVGLGVVNPDRLDTLQNNLPQLKKSISMELTEKQKEALQSVIPKTEEKYYHRPVICGYNSMRTWVSISYKNLTDDMYQIQTDEDGKQFIHAYGKKHLLEVLEHGEGVK